MGRFMTKKALITGITGQDGAVLADILLQKGYDVHGMRLYSATPDDVRTRHLDGLTLHYGDMGDGGNIMRLIETIKPDEVYNLAAMSHVHVSFDVPEMAGNINALGPLRFLEAIRNLGAQKQIRFYQASSSEMFGRTPAPQNEETYFSPCSPYGTAKLYAYWMVRNYREAYGLHASNGILFNHESALRGEEFVTRKITKAVCEIEAGLRDYMTLGNLDSKRDWGHAHDYMNGAWAMLQQPQGDDYVLASEKAHSVRAFVNSAFAAVGIMVEWEGEGLDEIGRNKINGNVLVKVDPKFYRPTEVHHLLGDAKKARKILNWKPRYSFDDLVKEMVNADRLIDPKATLKVV